MEELEVKIVDENVEKKSSTLANVSLAFLIAGVVSRIIFGIEAAIISNFQINFESNPIVSLFSVLFNSILMFPWHLVSLILAIISRSKNKDKKSKILIIVNIVIIALKVLLVVGLFGLWILLWLMVGVAMSSR